MNASIAARAQSRSVSPVTLAAYGATATFIVLAVMFAAVLPAFGTHPPLPLLMAVGIDAIAFHLLLFPVIAALPAPSWAKAAGYGWLVVDIASNVMAINGVAGDTTTALRLGGHIAAVTWVAAAAYSTRGWTRIVGYALAAFLGSYSFWGQYEPQPAFGPALLLMAAWVALCAWRLQKGEGQP